MLKLQSKEKRNLVLTFFFLIGLIGLKSHISIIFVAFIFLFSNLLTVIQEYNKTKTEAKQIKIVLTKKWDQKRKKLII